jgi:hypothetical protein
LLSLDPGCNLGEPKKSHAGVGKRRETNVGASVFGDGEVLDVAAELLEFGTALESGATA